MGATIYSAAAFLYTIRMEQEDWKDLPQDFFSQQDLDNYDLENSKDSEFLLKVDSFLSQQSCDTLLSLTLKNIPDTDTWVRLWSKFQQIMNGREDQDAYHCTFLVNHFERCPFQMQRFFDETLGGYAIEITMQNFKPMDEEHLVALMMAMHGRLGQHTNLAKLSKELIEENIVGKNKLAHVRVTQHVTTSEQTMEALLKKMYSPERSRLDNVFAVALEQIAEDRFDYESDKEMCFLALDEPKEIFKKLIISTPNRTLRVLHASDDDSGNSFVVHVLGRRSNYNHMIFGVEFNKPKRITIHGFGFQDAENSFFSEPNSLYYFTNRLLKLMRIVASMP